MKKLIKLTVFILSFSAVTNAQQDYLKNISFTLSKYKKIDMPYYGKALLTVGEEDVISFVGEKDERIIGAIGFDIHNSDIALKKEFPFHLHTFHRAFHQQEMCAVYIH